jgi:hypothetical protein
LVPVTATVEETLFTAVAYIWGFVFPAAFTFIGYELATMLCTPRAVAA